VLKTRAAELDRLSCLGYMFSRLGGRSAEHSANRTVAFRPSGFLGSILLSEHRKASTPDSLDREYSPRSGPIVREPVSRSLRSLRTRKWQFGCRSKCSNSMELGCAVFVSPSDRYSAGVSDMAR
jgi:hypothetical protein